MLHRLLGWVRRMTGPYLERVFELELFDRAVALASQAFVALIPFMVVTSALLPQGDRSGFADSIVRRFHLHDPSAQAVRTVFAAPAEVQSTLSAAGIFLLVISALSFCRALQRLYEKAWRLPSRGVRQTGSHLLWLLLVAGYSSVAGALNTAAAAWLGPGLRIALALALSFFLWLWTPFILLGGRIERRRLRATALLTAAGMLALSAASVVYMPHTIETSSARYGPIGIAIAIVSWLISAGFVLVIGAAFGAVIADRSAWVRAAGAGDRGALQSQPD